MLRILAAALAELRRPLTLVLDNYDIADADLDRGWSSWRTTADRD